MYTSCQSVLAVLSISYLQIIPPHDTGIAAAIEAQAELWKLPQDAASSPLVTDPLRMVTQRYYYSLQQELSFRPRQDNPKAAPVVYTPLHGVGLPWLQKVPRHPFLHQACIYVNCCALTCCLLLLIRLLSGSPKTFQVFLLLSVFLFLLFCLHLASYTPHPTATELASRPCQPPTNTSPHLLLYSAKHGHSLRSAILLLDFGLLSCFGSRVHLPHVWNDFQVVISYMALAFTTLSA